MTALAADRAPGTRDTAPLTATESAIAGIAVDVDAFPTEEPRLDHPSTPAPSPASGESLSVTAAGAQRGHAGSEQPTERAGPRAGSPTPIRPRLVPALSQLARLTAPTGPGHSRPPTLDERVLARRRAALTAERAAATAEAEATVGPVPTSDPTSVCCCLVLAAVESLAGIRAVAQLARWVTPEVYEALSTRAALTVRVLGAGAASRRPEVRRVRVCRIGEHVAEASVVIDDGRRVRAVAVRLESWRGAWRAVTLEIG